MPNGPATGTPFESVPPPAMFSGAFGPQPPLLSLIVVPPLYVFAPVRYTQPEPLFAILPVPVIAPANRTAPLGAFTCSGPFRVMPIFNTCVLEDSLMISLPMRTVLPPMVYALASCRNEKRATSRSVISFVNVVTLVLSKLSIAGLAGIVPPSQFPAIFHEPDAGAILHVGDVAPGIPSSSCELLLSRSPITAEIT